jgi:hypothetical protein
MIYVKRPFNNGYGLFSIYYNKYNDQQHTNYYLDKANSTNRKKEATRAITAEQRNKSRRADQRGESRAFPTQDKRA